MQNNINKFSFILIEQWLHRLFLLNIKAAFPKFQNEAAQLKQEGHSHSFIQ
jgi:hypothetical protein